MSKSILLFDGVCNLCNSAVRFFYTRDKKNRFLFQSLQSDQGKELLQQFNVDNDLSTIVLVQNGKLFTKSTAVLKAVRQLGFPYIIFYPFIWFPKFVRDEVYDFVARNRYKWFGKRDEVCEYDANFKEKTEWKKQG